MTYILEKHGNNLYVAPEGNDQSAIKGFTSKAWKTLAAALAASEDGDVIIVQKGEYTIDSKIQLDPLAESRKIVFEEGTIVNIGDGVYFYSGDETTGYDYDGKLEVVCKGKIVKSGTGGTFMSTTFSGSSDFYIKELNGELRGGGGPINKIKIDKINYTNTTSDQNHVIRHFFSTDTHPTTPDVPTLIKSHIEIGEFVIADNVPNIFSVLTLLADTLPGSYYHLKVDNTVVGTGTRVGEYRFGTNGGTNTFEGDVTLDLGTITNLSTTGNTTTNYYSAYKNTHAAIGIDVVMLNGKLVVKTDSITAPNTAGMGATSLGLDNSYGLISLKNVYSGDYGFNSRVQLTNGSTLIIDCDIEVDGDKPALCLVGTVDATSKVIVRGRYVNTGAYPAITIDNSLSTYVQFEGVTYINDGTVAGLQTDAACTVNIVSAATNVLIGNVDVNVTFNGGTVLRDANFK
jgi:hypothetical protein